MRVNIALLAVSSLSLSVCGCGQSGAVWVTCDVAKGGKTYSAPQDQTVQVTFYALEAKDEAGKSFSSNQPFAAAPAGDGRYEVPGPDGRGSRPGNIASR